MGFLLLILGLAKLPMYRLHIWLPKVHVEASITRSIVLAGAVLKLRILYCWNFRGILIVRVVLVISVLVIMSVIDRKGFAAYSSVLHISLCVIFGLLVMLLVGYIHIVLSPLIFITVYKMYNLSGSRFYMKVRLMMMVLWLINFRLPFVRSFFSEVYIIQYVRLMLLVVVVIYIIVRYVVMKSLNIDGKGIFYIPFIVLYLLMV
jgi:NADH:ubiquinone oxidoreductase subunit 4 (subunit M)